MQNPSQTNIVELLDHLQLTSAPVDPRLLRKLSDLPPGDLNKVEKLWPQIPVTRRKQILSYLLDIHDTDMLMDFTPIALFTIHDALPDVRAASVEIFKEATDPKIAEILLQLLRHDPAEKVRLAAAKSLAGFVYLSEIDELDAVHSQQIQDCLIELFQNSESPVLQHRCLEALGYSSREELVDLIQSRYDTHERAWLVSSLIAMGRSLDERWEPHVLRHLHSRWGDVQEEAVRAAGLIGIRSALRPLIDLLEDEGTDREVRTAVIDALAEIGGDHARETLEARLTETEDDEEIEAIEEALDKLTLADEDHLLDFLDIDPMEQVESGKIIDLANEDNLDEDIRDGEEADETWEDED